MAVADFISLDVETAARHRHSICQIGIVGFSGGREVFAREILVDPGCDFDPMNTWIHGLTGSHVRGAATFKALHKDLAPFFDDQLVVAHSSFDETAMNAACVHHGLSSFAARWADTVAMARRAWPDLPNHRLSTVAAHIGHAFRHHNALEDARAAGAVALAAMEALGSQLGDWVGVSGPFSETRNGSRAALRREGDGDGPLVGHCVVMTGDFTAPKHDLADLIHTAGGAVAPGVTKATTILVIGDRDAGLYGGKTKSGKQIKAEALRDAGQDIELISEAQLRGYFG
jgi:DNA polymerase III subunit epsilon